VIAMPGTTCSRRPRLRRIGGGIVVAACGWLVATLLNVSPAAAHATVISTTPENGAILDQPVETVEVTFNEVVEPRDVTVVNERGERTDIELGRAETLEVPVDTTDGGWFAVSWRVISADGHPVSGAVTFRVGAGAAEAPESLREAVAGASATDPADVARTIARSFALGGLIVLAGSAFLRLWALERPVRVVRHVAHLAAGVAVIGGIAALVAAAAGELLTWPGSIADAAPIAAVVAAAWRGVDRSKVAAVVFGVALAALAAAGLTGHVAADGRIVARVGLVAHLIAAAVWLGAVPALVATLRSGAGGWTVVGRFSRSATVALAVVVAAGTATALLLAGELSVLTGTTWGQLVIAKVALVAVAVGAGAVNRYLLGGRRRPELLGQLLLVEGTILVAVIAVSGLITRNSPEPEAEVDEPVNTTVDAGPLAVEVLIGEPTEQERAIHVTVYEDGRPREIDGLTLTLASDENGIAPIPQELVFAGPGHLIGTTDDLRLPGAWLIDVAIRVDRFTEHSGSDQISVS
jgi:copper transport protein